MPSLPSLPGPAVQGVPSASKGAFMSAFVNTLTQHINQILAANRQRSDDQRNEQQAIFKTLLGSGDSELAALGLSGLLDEKAGSTDFLGRLKKSPVYEQAREVLKKIHGAQDNPESLLEGMGSPPAAQAPASAALPAEPTIPQGTAAPAAFPLGASEAGVTTPAMPPLPQAAPPQAAAPTAAPAQGTAGLRGGGYADILKTLGDLQGKARFSPTANERIRKAIEIVKLGEVNGVPATEIGQRLMDEMAPVSARIDSTNLGRTILVTAEEAQELGIPNPTGAPAFNIPMLKYKEASQTKRTGMQVTGANERAANRPRPKQLRSHQPVPGGPAYLQALNPETGAWETQYTDKGEVMRDSPEFRKMLSQDTQGNIQESFVIPGGGGGAPSGGGGAAPSPGAGALPPPPGDVETPPRPGERRAPTLPKIRGLVKDLQPVMKPYMDSGDMALKVASLKDKKSGAAQIGTLYGYVRSLDPNRVTQGELELSKEAQSLWSRIKVSMDRGLGGKDIVISPELQRQMSEITDMLYDTTIERQIQTLTHYADLARQEGLNPKQVIGQAVHPALIASLKRRAQFGLSDAEESFLKLLAEAK